RSPSSWRSKNGERNRRPGRCPNPPGSSLAENSPWKFEEIIHEPNTRPPSSWLTSSAKRRTDMHSQICLDANIFIAAMVPEDEDHDAALEVLKKVLEREFALYEPAVVLFEVVSAFHHKVQLGELTKEEEERLTDLFFQLPLLLQWQPVLMKKAIRIA